MSPTRTSQGYPWVVASLCGFVVALVSGGTGIVAHWLASTDPLPVTAHVVVATVAACAGVGILTTAGVGRFHPGVVVPAGLVAAQGSVHYALDWSHRLHGHAHAHAGGGGSGHATHMLTPMEQSELVREAIVAGATVASHSAPDWPMLAAHAVASIVTAGALALVTGVLGWLVARAEDLTIDVVLFGDRPPATPRPERPRAAVSTFLLSRGLQRGPPGIGCAPNRPAHAPQFSFTRA